MAKKKKEVGLKEVSRTEVSGTIIIKYEDGSIKIIPAPIALTAEEAEDLFGSESDEEEEDDDDDSDEEEEEEPRSTFSFFKKKEPEVEEESSNSKISQPFDNTITASREAKKRRFTSTGSKVVSMNGRGVEVYVIKPQDFAEAQTAADLLKEGRTVVINLEGVELTVAQRSIDFVGGATYAINGSLQAVSNNIFIAAPDSIEVSGDLKSEIMNENTISPQLK